MPKITIPWLSDFTRVPAAELRLGRYALQLVLEAPGLSPAQCGPAMTGALWPLLLPLMDQAALTGWLPETPPAIAWANDAPDWDLDWEDEADEPDPSLLDWRLKEALHKVPRRVLHHLFTVDATIPVDPTVQLLGDSLELAESEIKVLDFLGYYQLAEPLRRLLRKCGNANPRLNRTRLAAALGLQEPALRVLLARQAPLRSLGLIEVADGDCDLEDYVQPSDLFKEVLDTAPGSVGDLLAMLIEPAPPAAWTLPDFPHLSAASRQLGTVLAQAATTGTVGVNALLYGDPGTGKTELARAVAADHGLRAWQVRSADEEGEGLTRNGRLSAYLLAQRLLARRRDALLIFDEVEDVFASADDLLALLRGHTTGRQKGWTNRILENNPVPAIWITNNTDSMDPAFLRRFLLPVACPLPPRTVRRQMAERHLGACGLSPSYLDELAADAALTPAQLGAARQLQALRPDTAPEQAVSEGVAALRTLLHGAPAPRQRPAATEFDIAFLNLDGTIAPGALVRALHRRGRGSLCFYGPPGTGKTAFAEVLAAALDRELIARQASDLLSPYIGETEQNLARLFRNSDPSQTVLLLDEVDSFLSDRRQARHAWERTQVNELLQQMERYPGIFIAATNLMSGIDPAALRRFDFKLHFRSLAPTQRVRRYLRNWRDTW
jgi:AAA+ superfamily predicted ATPase